MPIGSDFCFSYLSASRQKVALLTSISLLDFLSFLDFQAPSMVLTVHGPMDFSIWICSLEYVPAPRWRFGLGTELWGSVKFWCHSDMTWSSHMIQCQGSILSCCGFELQKLVAGLRSIKRRGSIQQTWCNWSLQFLASFLQIGHSGLILQQPFARDLQKFCCLWDFLSPPKAVVVSICGHSGQGVPLICCWPQRILNFAGEEAGGYPSVLWRSTCRKSWLQLLSRDWTTQWGPRSMSGLQPFQECFRLLCHFWLQAFLAKLGQNCTPRHEMYSELGRWGNDGVFLDPTFWFVGQVCCEKGWLRNAWH